MKIVDVKINGIENPVGFSFPKIQGDVDEELLENFLSQLDKEVEYEDQGLF